MERDCFVRWTYDPIRLVTRIEHGREGEAMLPLDDLRWVEEGTDRIAELVEEWADRVHEYEDGRRTFNDELREQSDAQAGT
jgi:hypothetical protein